MVEPAANGSSRGRTLVADDEPHIRRILTTLLEAASFEVDPVPDGPTAIEHRRGVPVVILTAKGQDADRDEAFNLGADDFVTKPFSPKKLLARIDEIFDRG